MHIVDSSHKIKKILCEKKFNFYYWSFSASSTTLKYYLDYNAMGEYVGSDNVKCLMFTTKKWPTLF